MDVQLIKTFSMIYENRSFARTAMLLFLTQSAVSQQIQRLEKEVGAVLFERSKHSVVPTEAARVYYPYAKRIVALVEESAEALAVQGKRFSIHYVDRDLNDPVAKAIYQMTVEQPQVHIHICPPLSGEAFGNPASMEVNHLYLARKKRILHPAIHFATTGCAFYQCVMAPEDRLAVKPFLTLEDLRTRKLMFAEKFRESNSPWIGELVTYLCRELGAEQLLFQPSTSAIHACIRMSPGSRITMKPGFVSMKDDAPLVSRPFQMPHREPLGMAYIGSLTADMQRFIELVQRNFPAE